MQLSKNLSLAEVIRSETAKRRGISNMPTDEHLANLKLLAKNIFQPIRDHFKHPIHLSSGYRSRILNEVVGGSASSQHCKGQAIDIDNDNTKITNKEIFDFIRENLEFDQLINEYDYRWVHVSFVKGKNRNQILKATKSGYKTYYSEI